MATCIMVRYVMRSAKQMQLLWERYVMCACILCTEKACGDCIVKAAQLQCLLLACECHAHRSMYSLPPGKFLNCHTSALFSGAYTAEPCTNSNSKTLPPQPQEHLLQERHHSACKCKLLPREHAGEPHTHTCTSVAALADACMRMRASHLAAARDRRCCIAR